MSLQIDRSAWLAEQRKIVGERRRQIKGEYIVEKPGRRTEGTVEHAIGGMKRYRVLSDRLRIHNCKMYSDAVEVCAGLWNFYWNN